MPKYRVSGAMTISVHTEVEASTKQEALEIAGERQPIQLCHQCATGYPEEEWCTAGELDGMALDLAVEEIEE